MRVYGFTVTRGQLILFDNNKSSMLKMDLGLFCFCPFVTLNLIMLFSSPCHFRCLDFFFFYFACCLSCAEILSLLFYIKFYF